MRTSLSKIVRANAIRPLLAAAFAVAITFTLSCSGGDDPSEGDITYGTPGGPGSSVLYDGETYETVVIGTQTWMAKNLNYNAEGSVCYANCQKYGRLYDWVTAMTVCPQGWHLPSDAEWGTLMKYVNPSCSLTTPECVNAGKLLKATSDWDWNDLDNISGNGTDYYGYLT